MTPENDANRNTAWKQQQQQEIQPRVNVLGMDDVRGSYIWMKDFHANLQHYGIKNGSKIMMMGDTASIPNPSNNNNGFISTATPSKSSSEPLARQSPHNTATHALEILEKKANTTTLALVETYMSSVLEYTSSVSSTGVSDSTDQNAAATTSKKIKDAHARVSELILQDLLKVDAVAIPEGDDEARGMRKRIVKTLNGMLDRVDGFKERVVEFEKNSKM
ncbi:hypothetical protein HK100_001994 [Physocladia obscura]|uniref:BAG domain-containing protein n=1 Tax=Physocladia obscura TaxID=109957 RepID=A0AAD5SWF0_9FUNG|nr:hypothetical protein HK100_001994 [Physocladia obscura]